MASKRMDHTTQSLTQAVRLDGQRRWYVFVAEPLPDGDTGSPRKAVWTSTADEARAKAEDLGYTVARVEPAPPPSWPGR